MPVSRPADDGKYEVHCAAGHISTVIVDNVKFELLFELGLNALVDGYPREAVSSFASALERFYEFYWRVVATFHSIPTEHAGGAWKVVAKQSERQLGMYVTAGLLLTKMCPPLLNPNQEVKFRNNVIHGGYIPTIDEAVAFGDVVMRLINDSLTTLRTLTPEALIATYEHLSPNEKEQPKTTLAEIIWDDAADHMGIVNIVTAVDVRHPVTKGDDIRRGGVAEQFARILQERKPHRLTLLDKSELEARFGDVVTGNGT